MACNAWPSTNADLEGAHTVTPDNVGLKSIYLPAKLIYIGVVKLFLPAGTLDRHTQIVALICI